MPDTYPFLLDLFPLSEEIVRENPVLGSTLQAVALDVLLAGKDDRERLRLLLKLSEDLGYASPEVVRFLLRAL